MAGGLLLSLAWVRRAVWGMLYDDDAGNVSKSAIGLAEMIIVIVTGFEASGLTVSEKNTEAMLLGTPDYTTLAPPFVIEAAGQKYTQKAQLLYLGGIIHEKC